MVGCNPHPAGPIKATTRGPAISAVDLSTPTRPLILSDGVTISTAKNAWGRWTLTLDGSQLPPKPLLRLPNFSQDIVLSAYQILPAPVNLNDADYVRQTGDRGDSPAVPRVLLPLPIHDNVVDLAGVRDPAHPTDPSPKSINGPVLIWVDLHSAEQTKAGPFTGNCELLDQHGGDPVGSVPVHLTIESITLPAHLHLHFAASLDWQTLASLCPDAFNGITPRLLSRKDSAYSGAIAQLDRYIQLAHENKCDLYVPRIQPIVKWPVGKPPAIDWTGFDSVVQPWFNAAAFADRTPLGFWPLPQPDSLSGFDLSTQTQYWHLAAEHFDQRQWLDRSPAVLKPELNEPINQAQSILLSAQARQILRSNPRLSVLLPLQDDQLQLQSPVNSAGIIPATTCRICAITPGVICPSPIRDWSTDALPPQHWLDSTGATQPGMGNEQAQRCRAWLAFYRDVSLVLCGDCLPVTTNPNQPARAGQLPWFYPGQWYGLDQPLQTIELKWTRQAEQDYEYLFLSNEHNDRSNAWKMCQLIARPLQLQPAQANEPLFDLLAGTTEAHACEQARLLLAARLQKPSDPKKSVGNDPVELQTLRWFSQRQHPTLVATAANWMWDLSPDPSSVFQPEPNLPAPVNSGANAGASLNANPGTDSSAPPGAPGSWISAKITCNLYNPADATPAASELDWTNIPAGWESHPAPVEVQPVDRYQVRSLTTTARFNLNDISPTSRQPISLSFVDGFNGKTLPCQVMLPVAISERRTRLIAIDGSLDDWFPADAIQFDQPLVRMLDRDGIQSPDLRLADTPTSIFTAWSDEHFYIAFRLAGVTAADLRSTRNFVEYDHGRAWGQDLCELLIQPIYIDNSTGPTLHVVCMPGGMCAEHQAQTNQPWQSFETSGIRYASGVDPAARVWREEVAIPWRAIQSPTHGRPALLRFNFIQHQHSTAQSASWAGPIDQSRDGKITGLLLLKEPG